MGWVEVWDQLAFTKLQALFVVGETKKLNPSDLPALPQSDSASELSRTAFAEWDASRSLLRSLWAVSRRHMLLSAPHAFLYVLCQIALPVVLQALLVWISGPSNANILIGAFYVALLFAIRLISTAVFRPQTFSLGSRAGIRAERTVMLLVSRKLLRLRGGARGTGEIVSALATDAKRFGPELLCFFHWIWTTPLQLILAIVLLFHFIGPAATAAFVVLVLSTCVMWVVARRERFLFDIVLKRSDARIRALSGLLDILRQAKMAGWEDVLARDVRGERVRQMEAIERSLATQAVGRSMFAISPAFTCAVAFAAVGVVPGSPALTSKVVFPVLALFEMIRVPIRVIPSLAAKIMQALVSAGRLQQFLEEDEYCGRLIMDDGGRSDVAGGVDGGLIGWIGPTKGEEDDKPDSETRPLALVNGKTNYGAIVAKESNGTVNQEIQMLEFSPVLRNVQLVLERGSLIIVRGPVGAGKSKSILSPSPPFDYAFKTILTTSF